MAPGVVLAQHMKPSYSILKALWREIDEFVTSSFDKFGFNITVHPVDGATPVFMNGHRVGVDRYVFKQWSGVSHAMKVRHAVDGKPVVWHLSRWKPVKAYLEYVYLESNQEEVGFNLQPANRRLLQRDHQVRWWKANGKHFPLMELPAEIREIIYTHTLPDKVVPWPKSRVRGVNPFKQAQLAASNNFSLLLVSKQVYHEAKDTLFSYTPFLAEHSTILWRVTRSITLQSQLRQLEIACTFKEYISLFSPQEEGYGSFLKTASPSAEGLKHMELNRLTLTLVQPSPYNKSGKFNECPKLVVDWLTKIAWPFVRGHAVELRGDYIKTAQKVEFESRCKALREAFEAWKGFKDVDGKSERKVAEFLQEIDGAGDEDDGGVLLDEEKRQQDRVLTMPGPKDVPDLRCHCKVPCSTVTWTDDD